MKKTFKLLVILSFFFLIFIPLFHSFYIPNSNFNFIIPLSKAKPEEKLNIAYTHSDRDITWLNFTDTGDFTDWYDSVYGGTPFDDFDDTGDHLYLYSVGLDSNIAKRELDGFMAYDIIQTFLNISVHLTSSGLTSSYWIRLILTDTSSITLDSGSITGGSQWFNKTILYNYSYSGKTVDYLDIWLSGYASTTQTLYLWDEYYKIYLPLIEEFTVSPPPELQGIEAGNLVQFKVDIFPLHPFFSNMILLVKYNDTDITNAYYLENETFDPVQKYYYLEFNLTGTYLAQIRLTWLGTYYYSEVKAFTVYPIGEGYPKTTHLSLWSPFDDLSLTGRLKTYLSVDECYKISDFKNEYGYGINLSWRPIYPSYSNQPSFSVTNTRLYLTCWGSEFGFSSGNGVEADLIDTINITHYDSLKFSLKVKNASNFALTSSKVLYLIINPSAWSGDYRLNLSKYTDYINEWVTFIVPFKLFTMIYFTDSLAELGFYSPATSGLLDCEIRDIYACNYNTLYKIINESGTTLTTNESIIRTDLPPLAFSVENTTSLMFNASINQTIFQNTTFENGFNNSQASWENVTILNNNTIQLSNITWWNDSFVYRRQLNLTESSGVDRIREIIDTYLSFPSSHCYNNSIRVLYYNGSDWEEIRSQLYNTTYSSNYISSTNLVFFSNCSQSSVFSHYIYYSNKSVGIPSYSGITRNAENITTSIDNFDFEFYPIATASMGFLQNMNDTNDVEQTQGNYYRMLAGIFPIYASAPTVDFLNEGNIFIDVNFTNSANEYCFFRVFDNGIVLINISNAIDYIMETRPAYFDVNPCKWDYWRFYDNGWQSNAISCGASAKTTYETLTQGKLFYDDSDEENVLALVWDESQANSDLVGFYERNTDGGNQIVLNRIGWDSGGWQLTQNQNYLFYLTLGLVGSTDVSNKQDFMDELYTILISNPLTQTLFSEESILTNRTGYYDSRVYDFNYTVLFNNCSYSWDESHILNISLAFSNNSINFSTFQIYTEFDTINKIGRYLKFRLNFTSTFMNETTNFYNFSINYTYYQFILDQNITKTLDIPTSSLINFTMNWSGYSNVSIDYSYLNIYNFSSNSFFHIGNITNTSQILSFSNNSDFFSNRNFTWNLNGSFFYPTGFSIQQINYTISYYRYQFDRQITLSTVNLTSYSNDLYGFTFENDFTNTNAQVRVFFANSTGAYFEFEQFNKTIDYTLFRQFSDYGLNKTMISGIKFNFTLYNASTYNENASIIFSKFFLYENQTYRLYSEENRMPSDVLQFDSEIETLLLTDYWGDIIYRERLNRTEVGEYLDLLIPYFCIRITNYQNYDILFHVEKNKVVREYKILAGFDLELKLILSDYKLVVIDGVKEITIYEGVLSHTSRGAFSYGTVSLPLDWESILTNLLTSQMELNQDFWESDGFWVGLIITVIGIVIDYFIIKHFSIPNFSSESFKEYKKEVKKEKKQKRKKRASKSYDPSDITTYPKKRRF